MRVLFFVEPVTFRDDPLFLLPWIKIIDAIVKCSTKTIEANLVTSRPLASLAKAEYASISKLLASDMIEPFGFDRINYMRDLCFGDGTQNDALACSLIEIRDRVMPDIVISWTENSTLRKVFAGKTIFLYRNWTNAAHSFRTYSSYRSIRASDWI